MINFDIRQFRNTITIYINSNNIPIEVKYLVVKDICNQLESEANKQIYIEQQQSTQKDSKNASETESKEDLDKEGADVNNKLSTT